MENRPVLPDPGAALKKKMFVTDDGRNVVVTFLLFVPFVRWAFCSAEKGAHPECLISAERIASASGRLLECSQVADGKVDERAHAHGQDALSAA